MEMAYVAPRTCWLPCSIIARNGEIEPTISLKAQGKAYQSYITFKLRQILEHSGSSLYKILGQSNTLKKNYHNENLNLFQRKTKTNQLF